MLEMAPPGGEIVFVLCGCETLMIHLRCWVNLWQEFEIEGVLNISFFPF